MFDQLTKQFQKTMQPMSELVAINARACEQLLQQQTGLLTGVMNEGANYAQSMGYQQDLASMMDAQKSYAENLQEKLVTAAKDSYAVMAQTQGEIGGVLNGAFSEAKEAAAEATAKATKAATKASAK